MCIDPVTAMMMIGTGMKMFGAVKDGEEQGRRMDENARQKQRLVEVERQKKNAFETTRERDKARKLIGRQIATFAENGIQIDGSARDVIEDSAREADNDIDMMN